MTIGNSKSNFLDDKCPGADAGRNRPTGDEPIDNAAKIQQSRVERNAAPLVIDTKTQTTNAFSAMVGVPRKYRYEWVDFAKGICIVAVVCLYAQRQVWPILGNTGWLGIWVTFAKPFRMPDFFLISGLFLSQVIDRPWRSYLDTKVAHYLYFLLLWVVLILPWSWLNADRPLTAWVAFADLANGIYHPPAMLWFILMLSVYFVMARLIRAVPAWIVLIVAAVLRIWRYETGIYPVDWFGEYFVFFYAGYIFSPRVFALAEWTGKHPKWAMTAFIAWAVANATFVKLGWLEVAVVGLVQGFFGIAAVIIASRLLCRFEFMSWLRYLGEHSIVVYLGFYLPMLLFVWLYQRSGVQLPANVLGSMLVVASITSAMVFYWSTRYTWAAFLFERPQWARLKPGNSSPGRSSVGQRI